MSPKIVINFSPGPAKLPPEVLEKAQKELIHYANTGISVMEMSHRSADFEAIIANAETLLREIMNIPDNYRVLFMHGGGTAQFAAIPLNLCSNLKSEEEIADYVVTGSWSDKAAKEAEKYIKVNRVIPKTSQYTEIPDISQWKLDPSAKYLFYTDNETIHGIEYPHIPASLPDIAVAVDMTSNFLTRPIEVERFGVIVAGTQKNCGIAGLAIVVVRQDLIGKAMKICPSIFDWKIMNDNKSLYNTPPTYPIYMCGLFLQWIKDNGGLKEMAVRSEAKSKLVYDAIDNSNGFYYSPVKPNSRSRVNIPFRVGGRDGNEMLEKKFLEEAKALGMIQLKGHRSVGGMRASLFNAMTYSEAKQLQDFMIRFMENNQ